MKLINTTSAQSNTNTYPLNLLGLEQVQREPEQAVYQDARSPFIEANAKKVELDVLEKECIIPVFAKDNEKTISHQEFVVAAMEVLQEVYPNEVIGKPEIRVSHQVKGRVPEAIHKDAKDLLPNEKTKYYERMAFVIRVPSIKAEVNGNNLSLMVGGVRAYNHENLYSKKSMEKFKFFIGFQNMVCCNLCVSTDGLSSNLRATSIAELSQRIKNVIGSYQSEDHIACMKKLTQVCLTEHQFAHLIGKTRMYQQIDQEAKKGIPELQLTDGQISAVAKGFYQDDNFKGSDGSLSLWDLFNLFTSANKSSYIDTFMERNTNAFAFTKGLGVTLQGDPKYRWYID